MHAVLDVSLRDKIDYLDACLQSKHIECEWNEHISNFPSGKYIESPQGDISTKKE